MLGNATKYGSASDTYKWSGACNINYRDPGEGMKP